eukprot:CAMPEP_0181280262 /NCGR_PEP_ID=MMETSP1097-20121128/12836_1 /TAXON_ID=35684 /ORGANISM="Pseudopedinella elastica, Strain CCMP716" /LENGTH=38 /DNA_ID= /DNA_START= /DNA_END= /DNA_ORIENTATION=
MKGSERAALVASGLGLARVVAVAVLKGADEATVAGDHP